METFIEKFEHAGSCIFRIFRAFHCICSVPLAIPPFVLACQSTCKRDLKPCGGVSKDTNLHVRT